MFTEREIEAYLLDKLPLNEKISFETSLKEDRELRKKLDNYRKKVHALENIARVSFLEDLDHWKVLTNGKKENEKEDNKEKSSFVLGPMISYTLAFVIIGLAAQISDSYDPIRSFSNSRAFTFYFEPISISHIYNSLDADDIEDSKMEAIERYSRQEYDDALTLLQEINKTDNDDALLLIEAISHLNRGEIELAIQQLEQVTEQNEELKEHAQWYLALASIKNGEMNKSKNILLDITDHAGIYHNKSMELLQVLIPLTKNNEDLPK